VDVYLAKCYNQKRFFDSEYIKSVWRPGSSTAVSNDGRGSSRGCRGELNRAGFKCVEALGRIIIRGAPYPPSNAIINMHLQL